MKDKKELDSVSIRFAGDSGDGMQLVGERFSRVSALLGNQIITFPDFPAEIRPPAGTVAGVSGYQLTAGSKHVYTSGDTVDVLVAMNPAAVKACQSDITVGGTILADADSFTTKSLEKAGFEGNPLETGELKDYQVYAVPMSSMVKEILKDSSLGNKGVLRCKNFFALGLTCWYLDHTVDAAVQWLDAKFKNKPDVAEANKKVLQAGFEYGESSDLIKSRFTFSKPDKKPDPGHYKFVTGNGAVALGLMAAADRAKLQLYLGSYPITPASEILHEISEYKNYNVSVLQAEDEIAAIGAAIGASFAGALGSTTTSGPGLALKSEFINLAVISELPLVIVDVQRAGPSTGMPTKSEQADLLQALWGRNGESPLIVLAATSPADCFDVTVEGARLALKYMTPVMVMTDGYLSLGGEVLKIPKQDDLPEIQGPPPAVANGDGFLPYARDKETLARPWMSPGMAGFEHRTGGLEKDNLTGCYTTDGENHHLMCVTRAEKINRVVADIPPSEVFGASDGKVLAVGWGSTYGAIRLATHRLHSQGMPVAHLHLRHVHPFPSDLGDILKRYEKILVPEIDLGQLNIKLRAEYLVDTETLQKVCGRPLKVSDIETKMKEMMGVSA